MGKLLKRKHTHPFDYLIHYISATFTFIKHKNTNTKLCNSTFYKIELLTACLMVRGKPSRIKPDSPFAALASRRLDNKFIIISSETNFPWLTMSASCKIYSLGRKKG